MTLRGVGSRQIPDLLRAVQKVLVCLQKATGTERGRDQDSCQPYAAE
jgi:hypothetical protein